MNALKEYKNHMNYTEKKSMDKYVVGCTRSLIQHCKLQSTYLFLSFFFFTFKPRFTTNNTIRKTIYLIFVVLKMHSLKERSYKRRSCVLVISTSCHLEGAVLLAPHLLV